MSRERGIRSEKIKNSHEVMFVVDSIDEAREIERMNGPQASMVKKQRLDHLKKKGEVSEIEMPDTWQRFMMECAQQEAKTIRG